MTGTAGAILLILLTGPRLAVLAKDAVDILHELEAADDEEIAARIREVLRHYQSEDPVGLPGDPIPDPLPVPDVRRNMMVGGNLHFQNMAVFGLSKFRIRYFSVDVATMKMSVRIEIEKVQVTGRYTHSSFPFYRRQGNFVLQLCGVHLGGHAEMAVERSGAITADSVDMDMGFTSMKLELENLSVLGSIVKNMMHGLEKFLFDAAKPIVLRQVNENLRSDVNKQLMKLPRRFPDSAHPVDIIVADVRNQLRQEGYDPLLLPRQGVAGLWWRANVTEVRVVGAASLYRAGTSTVTLRDHVITATLDLATGPLRGYCHWEVSIAETLSHSGELEFQVEGLRVKATVEQPTDIRKRGTVRDLQLEVGEITARSAGLGSVDYLLDGLLTVVPTLVRFTLEHPLKAQLQDAMDDLDLEQLIERNLPAVRKRVKAVRQHYQHGNTTAL